MWEGLPGPSQMSTKSWPILTQEPFLCPLGMAASCLEAEAVSTVMAVELSTHWALGHVEPLRVSLNGGQLLATYTQSRPFLIFCQNSLSTLSSECLPTPRSPYSGHPSQCSGSGPSWAMWQEVSSPPPFFLLCIKTVLPVMVKTNPTYTSSS
jgi:hypothetical protein